jgi:hypothetical protein
MRGFARLPKWRIQPMLRVMNRRRFIASVANGSLALSVIPAASLLVGQGCATPARSVGMTINDEEGSMERTEAPVSAALTLEGTLARASSEGRLIATEDSSTGQRGRPFLPLQALPAPAGSAARLAWRLPPGPAGRRSFTVTNAAQQPESVMVARVDAASGQYLITDSGNAVLRYDYATVEPGAVLDSVAPGNRKYAVARSDYIHPLWGPHGEELTRDWPVEHPHHRGIYWAWPEVDWKGQRSDLHALQLVFARPTGRCVTTSGPLFAQVDAENVWKWQDREEIVRERAIIRAWRHTTQGRLLDLEFHFTALQEPVLVARRGTDLYGGLNIRLAAVKEQKMYKHLAAPDAKLRPSWADLSGAFPGAASPAGVSILQHRANPDYPGDWIEYPELNWLQPTFPAAGTRYALLPGRTLALRFRLWIHPGATPAISAGNDYWQAANSSSSPLAPT